MHLFLVQQKETGNGPGACLELACNISCSRNKLDTTGILFCTIKNELVQVKGTNLVQQIEDHAPKSFTMYDRRCILLTSSYIYLCVLQFVRLNDTTE